MCALAADGGDVTTWTAVSVTGHRDLTDAQTAWLRPELDRVNLKLVAAHGTTDAATGMALGSDQEFGWSALFAGMRLHAHVPFPQQAQPWTREQQNTYRRLLERCTTRTVYGSRYDVGLLFARNTGLLNFAEDRAGVVVAVWDPAQRSGGTYDTVRKAAGRGLSVIHLDPAAMRVHGPGCSCVESLKLQATLFD
jgi:hypothetical protein